MTKSETRERIAAAGLQTLSEGGFAAVTIGRLADATKLSKSGLFAHFHSREGLELALLDAAAQSAQEHVVEPGMRSAAGLPRLMALVGLWFGWSARAGLAGGCPIAAGFFEFDDVPGVVRDRMAALDEEWQALLRGEVRTAIEHGHLDPRADPEQIVWEIGGIYLAHHVSTRFRRDPHADRRAQTALVTLLQRCGADPANLQPGRAQ